MAEPRIKPALESADFTSGTTPEIRGRLDSCLKFDHANIKPKAKGGPDGQHVAAIQAALTKIRGAIPALGLPEITDSAGVYGPTTAAAVLRFKQVNRIQRTGQPMDDIVGRMTITALDDDLKSLGVAPAPTPPGPPTPPPAPPGPPTPPTPPTPPPPPNVLPVKPANQNGNIILDGTKAPDAEVPMLPDTWVNETQATLDIICSIALGRSIVAAMPSTIIRPFPENDQNAFSKGKRFFIAGAWVVEFTSSLFNSIQNLPGARGDEVLLHEMIHILESNFGGYVDLRDKAMKWDGADFVTVNGTNVYSTALSRPLRKDHTWFETMPARYASDAREHLVIFRDNYQRASNNNAQLVNMFKAAAGSWNPFVEFDPNVRTDMFFVDASVGKDFSWRYDLFSDFNARWFDLKNVAEYGIGRWRREGSTIAIDWKGGANDRFPEPAGGAEVSGRGKFASGIEYDTRVTSGQSPPPQPKPFPDGS